MVTTYYGPGSMLSVTAVFLRKAALRPYIAYTDCEVCNFILFIRRLFVLLQTTFTDVNRLFSREKMLLDFFLV